MANDPNPTHVFPAGIPGWLHSLSTQAILKGRDGKALFTKWTPAGGGDTFDIPMGGADSPSSGTWVGERYSEQDMQEAVDQGLFPMLPTGYRVTLRDGQLLRIIAVPSSVQVPADWKGMRPAWDELVVPKLVQAGISVDLGPVAPNSTPGAPGVRPSDPPPLLPAGIGPTAPPPANAVPLPVAPVTPLPVQDQTLGQLLEAHFPGKGERYAKALGDLNALGSHPDPGAIVADVLPLFGISLGRYGPAVALFLSLAAQNG